MDSSQPLLTRTKNWLISHKIAVIIVGTFALILIGGLVVKLLTDKPDSSHQNQTQQSQQSQNQASNIQEYWQNEAVTSKLPACQGNNYLSSPLVPTDQYDRIAPLGNIGPPGHTYPTDHLYMTLKRQNLPGGNVPTMAVQVLAPGDAHVIGVRATDYYTAGQLTRSDYVYAYQPCRELTFYNAHVLTLSGGLKAALAAAKKECDPGSQKEGDQEFKTCTYHMDYQAKSGEELGTSGGRADLGAFDWGGFDLRTSRLGFLNKTLDAKGGGTGQTTHTICPLDYYAEPLKSQLYNRLAPRSAPRCGTVMQDLIGTIQGNWRLSTSSDWAAQLAVVHDNYHPDQGVISVGGTITGTPGTVYFAPTHSGLVNREPSEVKADGQVYCYAATITSNTPLGGRVLLQLDGANLKAEHQDGGCIGTWAFGHPTAYIR
jgi:hypothetical protein